MAVTTFSRMSKIRDATGRSDYISNTSRQEEIVLHEDHKQHTWQEYSEYEKANQRSASANNEAREIIIALPNDLANQPEKLSALCQEIAKQTLGENRDYEFAVHWNKDRTNLHAHILFSERERVEKVIPKVYKRDMWYDKTTNKMAKAGAVGAELRYRKGETQCNADGTPKYSSEPFTAKDKAFISKQYLQTSNKAICEIMNRYGYDFRLFDRETETAQRHIGKNWNDKDAKAQAEQRNQQIRGEKNKPKQQVENRTLAEASARLDKVHKSIDVLKAIEKEIGALEDKIEGLQSKIVECGYIHPFKKRGFEKELAEETQNLAEVQEKIKTKYKIDPGQLEKYLEDAQIEKTRLSNILNPPKKKQSVQSKIKDLQKQADEYNRNRPKKTKTKSQDLSR